MRPQINPNLIHPSSQVGRPVLNGSASTSTPRAVEKQPVERAARVSRDELLDQLFALFTPEQPFWSLKELRRRTNQPEAYLKEILADIADFHRHGPNTNTFSLKSGFGAAGAASAAESSAATLPTATPGASSSTAASAKMEEDDDEDDDEDMEEIS
jgi:transcription initiation factor TFIIF subunit beta